MQVSSSHAQPTRSLRWTAKQHLNQTLNSQSFFIRMAPVLGLTVSAFVGLSPYAAAQPSGGANKALPQDAGTHENVTTMQPVTVESNFMSAGTPYAGGQVTTGARLGLLGDKDFMETPFSTISYTEKYIADQQAKDISEVISKTDPTVFNSGIPGESNESYSIRGFRSDIGDVTVNGLAGMAGYYRNSPEMFERIEVLRGPSALLNGMPPKGSVGGAINLVTKRATEEPFMSVTGTYSSNSTFGGHVDLSRRFGKNKQLGMRFNGAYRNGETSVKSQDKEITLASLALDWRGEHARVSADLYQSQDKMNGLTRGITLAPGLPLPNLPKPDTSWNPPWAFYDTKDMGAILRGDFEITNKLKIYATAGMSTTKFTSNMGTAQVFNKAGDFRINYSGVADDIKRRSAEVGIQGKARTGPINHDFALNATYYSEDYHLNGYRNLLPKSWVTNLYNPVWDPEPALPSNIPPIQKTETRLISFGLADTLSFAEDRVQLTLGIRHQQVSNERFNGRTGIRLGKRYKENALTPAVALLIKATDRVSLYANYIEGLSQGAVAPMTAANAGEVFAPYKTKQTEIGLKFDFEKFSHTISFYEIKRPSSYTNPVTNVFSFGGEQRNRGIEWGFFGSPLQNVRLLGGVAYLDATVTKATNFTHQGKQATGLPKWQAKLGVEWDLPAMQGLTLIANATMASKQYINADNTLSAPGHVVFDVGARYVTKMAGNTLTLRASITNVTNKAYWAKPHFTSLAMGAPRTYMLSASMTF